MLTNLSEVIKELHLLEAKAKTRKERAWELKTSIESNTEELRTRIADAQTQL